MDLMNYCILKFDATLLRLFLYITQIVSFWNCLLFCLWIFNCRHVIIFTHRFTPQLISHSIVWTTKHVDKFTYKCIWMWKRHIFAFFFSINFETKNAIPPTVCGFFFVFTFIIGLMIKSINRSSVSSVCIIWIKIKSKINRICYEKKFEINASSTTIDI